MKYPHPWLSPAPGFLKTSTDVGPQSQKWEAALIRGKTYSRLLNTLPCHPITWASPKLPYYKPTSHLSPPSCLQPWKFRSCSYETCGDSGVVINIVSISWFIRSVQVGRSDQGREEMKDLCKIRRRVGVLNLVRVLTVVEYNCDKD